MRTSTFLLSIILAVPTLAFTLDRRQAPSCVLQCIGAATGGTSCVSSDTQCLCTNQLFIGSIAACLPALCNAADAATGIMFGEGYCASVGSPIVIPNGVVVPGSSAVTGVVSSSAPATSSKSAVPSSAAPVVASTPAAVAPAPSTTAVASAAAATTAAAKSGANSMRVAGAMMGLGAVVAFVV